MFDVLSVGKPWELGHSLESSGSIGVEDCSELGLSLLVLAIIRLSSFVFSGLVLDTKGITAL